MIGSDRLRIPPVAPKRCLGLDGCLGRDQAAVSSLVISPGAPHEARLGFFGTASTIGTVKAKTAMPMTHTSPFQLGRDKA